MFRSSFFSMSKYYRKEMKIREFRQNLVNQLDQLRDENPSQYWALLNELSNAYTKNETSEVPTNAWFSYFKNLNEKKNLLVKI